MSVSPEALENGVSKCSQSIGYLFVGNETVRGGGYFLPRAESEVLWSKHLRAIKNPFGRGTNAII